MKSLMLLLAGMGLGLGLAVAATAGNDSIRDAASHASRSMMIASTAANSFLNREDERSRSSSVNTDDEYSSRSEAVAITAADGWLMLLVGGGLVFYQLHRRHKLLTQRPIPYETLTDTRHVISFES